MKIQLLIAVSDKDYTEKLSSVLSEKYADVFEISVCTDAERLRSGALGRRFDAALLDSAFSKIADLSAVRLPLLLYDDSEPSEGQAADLKPIRKYQRISGLANAVMGSYAEVSPEKPGFESGKARIVAFWSPCGGAGTTTAALAYAMQKAAEGKKTVYLDLQPFSSTDVYFSDSGESISSVFAKLESNLGLLLQSVRQEDRESGIFFFGKPNNYDDLNILRTEDVLRLIRGCAEGADIVAVDLPCVLNERSQRIFELADEIAAVLDNSMSAQIKWRQFVFQHDVYEKIRAKMTLVGNRGAKCEPTQAARIVSLPPVKSKEPRAVCKTLSANYFA